MAEAEADWTWRLVPEAVTVSSDDAPVECEQYWIHDGPCMPLYYTLILYYYLLSNPSSYPW